MISDAFMLPVPTASVGQDARTISHSVVADDYFRVHSGRVITREQLLQRLNALVDGKKIKNVDIAKALDLPDSRIPALLRGERRIYFDEATRLVEAFGLEPALPERLLPASVLRLGVRHVALKLDAPLNEPVLEDLAEDLRAFFEFASGPTGRPTVEAAEVFFRALQIRRREPQEGAPQESDPEQTH